MGVERATVSVVIPCYRQGHLVRHAIDSVVAQDAVSVQVILVDDGSPDDTWDVARSYGGRILYVRTENGGVSRARNIGIEHASADLMVFLDADDWLSRDWLVEQVRNAGRHPDVDVFCSGWQEIDSDDVVRASFPAPEFDPDPFHRYLQANVAPPHAHMIRRRAVELVGGFDASVPSLGDWVLEDWDFWLRVSAAGCRFLGTDGVLANYRRYSGSRSSNALAMQKSFRIVRRRYSNVHRKCHLCRERVRRPLRADRLSEAQEILRRIFMARRSGEIYEAWALGLNSIRTDPGILIASLKAAPSAGKRRFAQTLARWAR